MDGSRQGIGAGICLFFALLLASIYLPDAGRGFVKDDLVWVATSRVEQVRDIPNLIVSKTGWFRPLVSASFAADYAFFGFEPRGYGVTNVLLLFGGVAAIVALLTALGAPRAIGFGGAFAWAFNFHGINMAVLWLSGRTALCISLWWTVAVAGFVRRGRGWPLAAAFLAMLSKEEGLLLPVLLSGWAWLDDDARGVRAVWKRTWPYWAVMVSVVALRSSSGAMTPWNAPGFYTYDLRLARLLQNGMEYADRALTLPVAVTIVFWLCCGRPRLAALDVRRVQRGMLWFALAFVPTILLPTRSSLYALLPSIGAIVALSAVAEASMANATIRQRRAAVIVFVALAILLWPVYKMRNVRYVREAQLASAILDQAKIIARESSGLVIVRDARDQRPTAEQAFGPLAAEASTLVTGGRITLWIDPPPSELIGDAAVLPPPPLPVVGEIRVEKGMPIRLR